MAQTQTADFQHVESQFVRRLFQAFAALAIFSFLISIAGRQIGSEIALGGHTDSVERFDIVIGKDVVSLPANMIRFAEDRRDGIAERIDVYAKWPSLDGYSAESRTVFNNQDKKGRLIFVSFEQRVMTHDMTGRYEPIYRPMLDGAGEQLANGLVRYKLPEKSGFLDEYLYVGDMQGKHPFVARCLGDQSAKDNLAPCDRDYHSGEALSMMVRFSPTLLDNWKALDEALSAFSRTSIVSNLE